MAIPGVPQTDPKWKKYLPWVLVGLILVVGGSLFPSFKQSIALLKNENASLASQKTMLAQERDSYKQQASDYKEQMTKEKSKSKYLKDYYENGQLKHEEGSESASSEARVLELQTEMQDATKENDMLTSENQELKKELAVKYNKDTERRGDIGIVTGGLVHIEPFGFQPVIGVDARVFDVLGISVRLGAFVTK